MLYLNNPLLTSDSIIASFETNVLHMSQSISPSPLNRFKSKLKSIFFSTLAKDASDETVLDTLRDDTRFITNYPKLKQVLHVIFSLKETDDKTIALHQLKSIDVSDWNMDIISSKFKDLNTHYKYFDEQETESETIQNLFQNLASACLVVSVLFENHNNPDDTVAYDYAYKLMVLCIEDSDLKKPANLFNKIAQETHKLLSQIDGNIAKPFHHALLVKLTLPVASDMSKSTDWIKLIKKEGIKIFPFFANANQIEQKIKETLPDKIVRAPKTLKEAESIAMLCQYHRADEDLDFADLCYRYKVSEQRFEACLDVLALGWPKKNDDSIPDILIQGDGVAENLYWLKLPTTDKRALIIGDITDCCFSIGGNSEQCVKDAVSLSDNALYILLKKSGKGKADLIINGSINDKDFKIIGQAYIWRSQNENICLDSIECLSHSVTEDALKKILFTFSTRLLQENPGIKYVTLGQGGNTPKKIFPDAIVSETIKKGFNYGDADFQYCIAKTPYNLLTVQQRNVLNTLLAPYSQLFKGCIDYLIYYISSPDAFIDQLKTLLEEHPSLEKELTPSSLQQLLFLTQTPSVRDFIPIDFVAIDKMTAEDKNEFIENISITRLLWRETTAEGLVRALKYLPERKRIEVTEKILEDACSHQDQTKLLFLKNNCGFQPTERLIKRISPAFATFLLEQPVFYVVDQLKRDGHELLIKMNRNALTYLLCSALINDANCESKEVLNHKKITAYVLLKLNEYKSPKSPLTDKGSFSLFNNEFAQLRKKADASSYDDTGPSVLEVD